MLRGWLFFLGLLIGPVSSFGTPSPSLSQLPILGTAYEREGAHSPLWFTADERGSFDLRYPSPERRQIEELGILVTDGHDFASELGRDATSTLRQENEGMAVLISGAEKAGRFRYEQELVTDPAAPVLRIRTRILGMTPGLRVFIRLKPSVNATRAGNIGESGPFGFVTTALGPSAPCLALVADAPWKAASVSYSGAVNATHEAWMPPALPRIEGTREAGPGELTLMGELVRPEGPDFSFDLALAMGPSAHAATTFAQTTLAAEPFGTTRARYEAGWRSFLDGLGRNGTQGPRFIRESLPARRAAQLLKMRESKLARGCFPPDTVWMRGTTEPVESSAETTYAAALGLLAAGDSDTPEAALEHLLTRHKAGSGAEAASAILLAERLSAVAGRKFGGMERESLRELARTLLLSGPTRAGTLPPGIQPEVSGSYDVGDLARKTAALRAVSGLLDDPAPALTAERWISQIERWVWMRDNSAAGGRYVPSSARYGFLELVRLGIREARDPRILSSLALLGLPGDSPPTAAELARRGGHALMTENPDAALAQMHRLERSGDTGTEGLGGDLVLHRSIEERSSFDSPMPFHREPARLAGEAPVPWSNSSRGTSRSRAP